MTIRRTKLPKLSCLLPAAGALFAAASAPAQSPWPLPSREFVQAATSSDEFEIAEARDALAQSRDPQVRAFAEAMIRDHTADSRALEQAAALSNLPPPTQSLSGDQAHMLGALQSLRAADFDQTYAKQQLLAHRQALIVTQGYADGGADPAVRDAARAALPMIQHHLEMAQRMREAVGGS